MKKIDPLIVKFIEYLSYEKKYSKHTTAAYKKDVLAFEVFCEEEFGQEKVKIKYVHYNQIRNWIVSMVNSGLSNRSINRKISSLKSFYKFLQKIEEIKTNPLSKHKVLKVQKNIQVPFTQEEVNAVIAVTEDKDDFVSVRNRLIVELFYSTGMRRSELITIKERDISFYDKNIKILGKRNKERFVPLLPSVLHTLEIYLSLKKPYEYKGDELFITEKGNKVYETLVYRVINSYFSQVSSKVKKSPHILRHTFATHLLNEGANLNSVKELLGHSSLASTQVYTHNSLEKIKQVYNQAHPRSQPKN